MVYTTQGGRAGKYKEHLGILEAGNNLIGSLANLTSKASHFKGSVCYHINTSLPAQCWTAPSSLVCMYRTEGLGVQYLSIAVPMLIVCVFSACTCTLVCVTCVSVTDAPSAHI